MSCINLPASQGPSLILLFAMIRILILFAGLVAELDVSLADVVKSAPEPRLAVSPAAGAEEVSKLGSTSSLLTACLLQSVVDC